MGDARRSLFDMSSYPKQLHYWQVKVTQALAQQQGKGVTNRSLKLFEKYRRQLGALQCVELMMPYGMRYGDTLVRLIDNKGQFIQLDGVTWSYYGEGPSGLLKVLTALNIQADQEMICDWRLPHFILTPELVILRCDCAIEK